MVVGFGKPLIQREINRWAFNGDRSFMEMFLSAIHWLWQHGAETREESPRRRWENTTMNCTPHQVYEWNKDHVKTMFCLLGGNVNRIWVWVKMYSNLYSTSLPKGFEVVYKRRYIQLSEEKDKSAKKKTVGQYIR